MKLSENGLESVSNLSDVDLKHEEFYADEFEGELVMSHLEVRAQKHGIDFIMGSSKSDLKVKIKEIPFDAAKRFAREILMNVPQSEDKTEFETDDSEMVTTPNTNKINGLDAKTEDLPTTPKEVRFTIDEAMRIENILDDLVDLYNKDQLKIFSRGFETIYMVKHRIKQMETK